jgi:selenocysteine lyase/cysteine desulfurase
MAVQSAVCTRARWLAAGSTDYYVASIGVPGGAIRASLGLASNIEDVERFLTFLEATYRDELALAVA